MILLRRRRFLSVLATVTLALLTACAKEPPAPVVPKSIEDRFAIKVGPRTVQMQVALHPAEQQTGLMFRQAMGAEEGMVFVFDQPQQMSFWMRNTPLPLDIGYFDTEGVLKEVYPLYPHDERSVASRARNLQFALEMNQGWYRSAGVKPGDRLDLKALADAIRARGLKPEQFGLR